jgi:hypothetical protein
VVYALLCTIKSGKGYKFVAQYKDNYVGIFDDVISASNAYNEARDNDTFMRWHKMKKTSNVIRLIQIKRRLRCISCYSQRFHTYGLARILEWFAATVIAFVTA